MKLLLDTHVLLWWLMGEASLAEEAQQQISAPENTVFYSAASVWELRIKQALGKVVLPPDFAAVLERQSFEALSVTVRHAHALAELPMHHRDPFDRMLIAQAIADDLTFVSHDAVVEQYPVTMLRA